MAAGAGSSTMGWAGVASAIGPSAVGAGSSATAIAAVDSSDAWGVTEAVASVSGAFPRCSSSVNVVVTPGVGFAPENHERSERRSDREGVVWSVVIELRGPLLRARRGLIPLFSYRHPRGAGRV